MLRCNLSFTGHITKIDELRETSQKVPVLNFFVSVDRNYSKENRNSILIRCALFGERALKLYSLLKPGFLVQATGTPSVHAYKKTDGSPAASLECTVEELDILQWEENGR